MAKTRDQKRAESKVRQAIHRKMTLKQRLKKAVGRRGVSVKETLRLSRKIQGKKKTHVD